VNLHAIYAETPRRQVERAIAPRHCARLDRLGKAIQIRNGIFNGTFFYQPLAASGLQLAQPREGIRKFG